MAKLKPGKPTPAPEIKEPREEAATPKSPAAPETMAAAVNTTMLDPTLTMEFPGEPVPDADTASGKDHLINDHKFRVNNKRRFLMDALCRALGTEMYLLEADKVWAPNPLGRGPKVSIRFTREFPQRLIVFDKFSVMPDPKILAFKQRLANENGYKYIYETPEKMLTHDRLNELLDAQKDVEASK